MKNQRSHRDAPADDAGGATDARTRPALSRRALVTVTALGGGAAIAGVGVPLLRHLEGSSVADPSAAVAAGGTSTTTETSKAVPSSSSTAPSSTSSAPETSTTTGPTTNATADGMGDLRTDSLTITVADGYRHITTTSMPDHGIDSTFRYPGTPSAQSLTFKVPTNPRMASQPIYVRTGQVFGVHLNSVVFDPKTAGYYNNVRDNGWNYTAERLDAHGAHTRPDGFYHYHAITDRWESDKGEHSALVAWAADGFPVYLRYGYVNPEDASRGVKNLASSYRMKSGSRPSSANDPGGTYDGTYVADYEYVEGLGDLDQCNGRQCVTPEFPEGTYAYFLTDAWPYVPNYLRGTPDQTFAPGFGGGSGPMGGSGNAGGGQQGAPSGGQPSTRPR